MTGMIRMIVTAGILYLFVLAAGGQPLPRCGPALDGQVSPGGCECRHDVGGALTGREAGWRWRCDLLRGPGVVVSPEPAGVAPPGLPPGFTFAPMLGQGSGGRAMGY